MVRRLISRFRQMFEPTVNSELSPASDQIEVTIAADEPDHRYQEHLEFDVDFSDEKRLAITLEDLARIDRSFTIEELRNSTDDSEYFLGVLNALKVDRRFVQLSLSSGEIESFISDSTLFHWFTNLNMRLGELKRFHLTRREMALKANSLRIDGDWSIPPIELIKFGHHYGLIGSDANVDQFNFPLAGILSDISPQDIPAVIGILGRLEDPINRTDVLNRGLWPIMDVGFNSFDDRVVNIVLARERISAPGGKTFEEIGSEIGITRSRAQQIEKKFWTRIGKNGKLTNADSRHKTIIPFLDAFLCDFILRRGSKIYEANSPDTQAKLFLAKAIGLDTQPVPNTGITVIGTLSAEQALNDPLKYDATEFPDVIDKEKVFERIASNPTLSYSDGDVAQMVDAIVEARNKKLNKSQKVYLALRQIGEPAHFTLIATKYNELFTDDRSSDHSIHAVLGRENLGIVWIGSKGTFALSEWGYERPSQNLFDAIAEIVRMKYEQTSLPVSFEFISDEVTKLRKVINSNSLSIATQMNPKLRVTLGDAFVPAETNTSLSIEPSSDDSPTSRKENHGLYERVERHLKPHREIKFDETTGDPTLGGLAYDVAIIFSTDGFPKREVVRRQTNGPREVRKAWAKLESGGAILSAIEPFNDSPIWEKIGLLPASSISGPEFQAQHRTRVAKLPPNYLISHVANLMKTGVGETLLRSTFSTNGRLEQANSAINRFSASVDAWRTGNKRDSRVTWTVPNHLLSENLELNESKLNTFWEVIKRTEGPITTLRACTKVERWLPLLSVESIRVIQSLRGSDIPTINKMLIKATRDEYNSVVQGPWHPDFPEEISSLCLYSLYQFEPTSDAIRLLNRLKSVHCTNIGHLGIFDPEALETVKRIPLRDWSRLTLEFSRMS